MEDRCSFVGFHAHTGSEGLVPQLCAERWRAAGRCWQHRRARCTRWRVVTAKRGCVERDRRHHGVVPAGISKGW